MSARGKPEPAPAYVATLAAHRMDRWLIAEREATIPAVSIAHARLEIVRAGHRASNVPPIRSLQRRSMPFATARPADETTDESTGQLALGIAA